MNINYPRKSGPRPYFHHYAVPDRMPEAVEGFNRPWLARAFGFVAAFSLIFSFFAPVSSAAVTVTWSGNGTDNGLCSEIKTDDSVAADKQVWQFNLTKSAGSTNELTASFDDGTTIAAQAQDVMDGPVAKWFITTDAGAKLNSASAIDGTTGPNGDVQSNLVISHCTVGETPTPPQTATVTIVKFIDGSLATANSANSLGFTMNASWDATNIGSGSGSFDLDADGFNGGPAYSATTADMALGASYAVSEAMNSTVGATCDAGKPFALQGYRVGSSVADASNNTLSTTAPNLINIQSNKFIIVSNVSCNTPPQPQTTLHFIKVVCDQYSDVAGNEAGSNADATGGHFNQFSNYNSGAFTPSPLVNGVVSPSEIPGSGSGCVRATGYQFKLSSNQAQTSDVMNTTATSGTGSNAQFSVNVSDLPANLQTAIHGNGLWVSEVTQQGSSFAAIRCYNDALNGDNLEFIALGNSTPENIYCIAYNIAATPPAPQTVTVTIAKFLDGAMATAQSANNTAFPMHASWNDPSGIGTSSGDFTLSPTGFNNANAYTATTANMQLGADYSTNEVMGDIVGSSCAAGKPYALSGYSTGDTMSAAESGTVSTTAPSFTNLQTSKFVVVHNVSCGVLGDTESLIHFIKVVCDQYSDVAGNESGASADASDGHFTQFNNYNNGAFTPSPLVNGFVNPSEIPSSGSGCNRATGYQFKLSSDQAQTTDVMTTTATAGSSTDAEFSINTSSLPTNLQTAINSGQLWVSEVTQSGSSFAALRCYNDALNGDNLEVISLNGQHPVNVYCIAYNISSPAPCQLTTATLNSGTATLFKGSATTEPSPQSDDSDYSGGGANAVATNPDGFAGAWNTSINDPNLSGSIWVSNTTASPTNSNGGQNDAWRLFSQSITIPAGATDITANIYFTGDNSVRAYLNNSFIGSSSDFNSVTNVSSVSLVPGVNEFEFAVKNDAFDGATNPTGVIYRVNISYCPTPPSGGGGGGGGSGLVSSGGGGGTPVSNLLSGLKYNDLNFNGVRDNNEPALSGWIIYLDLNNNNVRDSGEPFQTTDVNGAYSFVNLTPATYTVREESKVGWSQFQPGVASGDEYSITVTSTSSNTNVNFGNAQGAVLGDVITNPLAENTTTTTPTEQGQVLGDTTTLPRTGTPISTIVVIILSAIACAAVFAARDPEISNK